MTIFIAGDEESQLERRSRILAPSQGSFPPVATSLQAVKFANVCNYSLTCMYNGKTIDIYICFDGASRMVYSYQVQCALHGIDPWQGL